MAACGPARSLSPRSTARPTSAGRPSQDGRTLFFASDRAGGAGGYDLYAARWDGKAWAGVESLGQPLNTAAAELGPAPSADGTRLFFTSDRNGKREDIFVARALPAAPAPDPKADPKAPAKPVLPPLPKFAAAEPVSALNSSADDAEAALTRRGDHVFLASDRDRKDATGFGIYLSRVVAGVTQPPEKVDLYFKAGDTTDPAVRMDGFDLLFSAKPPTPARSRRRTTAFTAPPRARFSATPTSRAGSNSRRCSTTSCGGSCSPSPRSSRSSTCSNAGAT